MNICLFAASKFNQIIPMGWWLKYLISGLRELGHSVFFRWDRPVPIGKNALHILYNPLLFVKYEKDFLREYIESQQRFVILSAEWFRSDTSGFNTEPRDDFTPEEAALFRQLIDASIGVVCGEGCTEGYSKLTDRFTGSSLFGIVESHERIQRSNNPLIDVLFFGSVSDYRAQILNELVDDGLNVVTLGYTDDIVRDSFVANSKIVLNINQNWNSAVVKAGYAGTRIMYLAHNGVACVSDKANVRNGIIENTLSIPRENQRLSEHLRNIIQSGDWVYLGSRARREFERIPLRIELDQIINSFA